MSEITNEIPVFHIKRSSPWGKTEDTPEQFKFKIYFNGEDHETPVLKKDQVVQIITHYNLAHLNWDNVWKILNKEKVSIYDLDINSNYVNPWAVFNKASFSFFEQRLKNSFYCMGFTELKQKIIYPKYIYKLDFIYYLTQHYKGKDGVNVKVVRTIIDSTHVEYSILASDEDVKNDVLYTFVIEIMPNRIQKDTFVPLSDTIKNVIPYISGYGTKFWNPDHVYKGITGINFIVKEIGHKSKPYQKYVQKTYELIAQDDDCKGDIIETILPSAKLYSGIYTNEVTAFEKSYKVKNDDWPVSEDTAIEEVNALLQTSNLSDVSCSEAYKVKLRTQHDYVKYNDKNVVMKTGAIYYGFHCYRLTFVLNSKIWNQQTHVWAWKNPDENNHWYLVLSSMCQRNSYWSKAEKGVYDQILPGYKHTLEHWLQAFLGDIEKVYPIQYQPIFTGPQDSCKIKKPAVIKIKVPDITFAINEINIKETINTNKKVDWEKATVITTNDSGFTTCG